MKNALRFLTGAGCLVCLIAGGIGAIADAAVAVPLVILGLLLGLLRGLLAVDRLF